MRPGDEPPRRHRPSQEKPHGNMRLVVAVMGAVILGLFIALLVSGGGGETKTVTVTHEVTTEVEATPNNGKSSEKEAEAEGSEGEEEEAETGGIEELEPEVTEEEGGEIEEVLPEEEGAIEEVLPEEEAGGGVEAE
ncbi:MAG TPA: hypothetical protein VH299_04280 [Solirubrobacterales bacterium]|nr:hypothetical protein [Solirubrobacterales bacterium]